VWEDLDFSRPSALSARVVVSFLRKGSGNARAVNGGRWWRTRLDKGFFISGLASPWTDWGDLIKEFLAAKRQAQVGDFGLLQSWRTGRLGLPWEEKVEPPPSPRLVDASRDL
jgi:hypothetical protein